MRRIKVFLASVLIFSLAAGFSLAGCSKTVQPTLRVVTGTTLISTIVAEVGGERASVVSIIPPSLYPADFELKPEDIKILSEAQLFIIHDWQKDKFSPQVIAEANNPPLVVAKIDTLGDWMVPKVQIAATDEVTRALMDFDRKNASTYEKRAKEYKEKVKKKESMILARAALDYKMFTSRNIPSLNIICAQPLSDFIRWLGLNVVGTYGRADSITPEVVQELVAKGEEKKVVMVVDSLQSGKNAGAGIAQKLSTAGTAQGLVLGGRTILSNYPGGFKNTETWEKAIDRNTGLLLGALEEIC